MNPKRFEYRSTEDVLATFVHEMTHLEQAAFPELVGKPSRTGYHNRAWGRLMKRVGLYPSSTGEPGGKETGQRVHHYIIAGGPFFIACAALLKTGFTIEYADIWKEREGRGPNKNKASYRCLGCDLLMWASRELPICRCTVLNRWFAWIRDGGRVMHNVISLADRKPIETAPAFSEEALALSLPLFMNTICALFQIGDGCTTMTANGRSMNNLSRSISLVTCAGMRPRNATRKSRLCAGQQETVAAVESLARSDRRIIANTDQWDSDPFLLSTPKGIVDLRLAMSGRPIRSTT